MPKYCKHTAKKLNFALAERSKTPTHLPTMIKQLFAACFLLFNLNIAYSQGIKISGTLLDADDNSALFGVNVILMNSLDTVKHTGAIADYDGNFAINNVQDGNYILKISFLGYATIRKNLKVSGQNISLGTMKMKVAAYSLKTVEIQGKQVRVEQREDTIEFRADAYKVHKDATTEDLITKMPGVTSDNGTVKVNGEQVQQVLVDGKPFFGDDPNVALKNLPAEVVDRVQVMDKLSDQAAFTGIDDGNSVKTINITTRKDKSNGVFGKFYIGYGDDNRFIEGGALNFFNGDRRISFLGLSNNINQQNFNMDDILGVLGQSGGGGRGGMGGGGRGGMGGGGYGGPGGGSGQSASSFLVGPQSGISLTNSAGFNYSDMWGKKIKITASYFFNSASNDNSTVLTRNYFTPSDSGLQYNEHNNTHSLNYNNRINLRMEYNIDSFNSIIFVPKISFQKNSTIKTTDGINSRGLSELSTTDNYSDAENNGYNASSTLTLRHKFRHIGRTISLAVTGSDNYKTGTTRQTSINKYFTGGVKDSILDQSIPQTTSGQSISTNLAYTEPLSKISLVMFSYNPSYSYNTTDKSANNFDSVKKQYSILDTQLSNRFHNTYMTQRGGISYRLGSKKLSLAAGVDYQSATLNGIQTFPFSTPVDRTWTNFLPQFNMNYKFSQSTNLRIFYRASTNAPSVSQLQDVVNNTNPLQLSTGNPKLQQEYSHNLVARFGSVNSKKAISFFVFVNGSMTQDYIGNSTFIANRLTNFEGYSLPEGSQLTRPVNLEGYYTGRTFMTLGLPVTFIKSNLNLSGGYTYGRTPALINNIENISNNYTYTGSAVLGSNISENLDFTLSYTGNYNKVTNSLQGQADQAYFYHTAGLKLNYVFLGGFIFNTQLTNTFYTGLSSSNYNQNFVLWNAAFGYKFLKGKNLELKVTSFDLLGQNKSISRSVSETYIEDDRTLVLQRYFMLNLTYTIRAFKGALGSAIPETTPSSPDGEHRGHRGMQQQN